MSLRIGPAERGWIACSKDSMPVGKPSRLSESRGWCDGDIFERQRLAVLRTFPRSGKATYVDDSFDLVFVQQTEKFVDWPR